MPAARAATLRVVSDPAARPTRQIATDLALLRGSGGATLRLYRFAPAGLSLGRFQDPALFAALLVPHEPVRRPTGGGAIFHDDDLTYALTLDDEPARGAEDWYALVHDALVAALADCGVRATRLLGGAPHPGPRALETAWCFAEPRRGDLVAPGGGKLAGSAQRRIRTPRPRLLLHGSIPLRRPAATPFCAAVEDQVDPDRVREPLRVAFAARLAAALGLAPEAGTLDEAERDTARALEPEVAVTGAAPQP